MNIGEFEDKQELIRVVGKEALVKTLKNAQAGWFNDRSWAYWHYQLGLSESEKLPPLPVRTYESNT
jgi:phosphoenolpyruvate synthase/pyruvate phosphate dikinase